MSRFVSCGKLRSQHGDGFKLPNFLRPKGGIFRGDLTIINDMLDKNGRLKIKLKEVTGYFLCSRTNITSLEGAPETVGGNFWCTNNPKLTSLEGAPETVGWDFYIQDAGRKFTEEEVRAVCDVKGKVIV